MKCADCGQTIRETFLKKIIGTYVNRNGKKVAVCSDCQKKLTAK